MFNDRLHTGMFALFLISEHMDETTSFREGEFGLAGLIVGPMETLPHGRIALYSLTAHAEKVFAEDHGFAGMRYWFSFPLSSSSGPC